MAKNKRTGDNQRKGAVKERSQVTSPVGGTWVKRDASSGKFLLGRVAFSRISAVEGIRVSKGLKSDLRSLDSSSYEKRRAVLAGKYGKRK